MVPVIQASIAWVLMDTGRQISPNIPDRVLSLVISNDRLYIATQQRGMFHISLEGESYSELSQK